MQRREAMLLALVATTASALRAGQPRHSSHNSRHYTVRHSKTNDEPHQSSRRETATRGAASRRATLAAFTTAIATAPANAEIGPDQNYALWPALPVAPYSRRKTIRRQVNADVWTFDQIIGIYYVHVPIRMTVVRSQAQKGLVVYAPVAPTRECLALLQELIDAYGPVRTIVLPSTAVEHKVLAGPFARKFPDAAFYAVDQQYSFPVPLPDAFLGLPRWTQPLPRRSADVDLWGGEFEHEVLTVKPGPGSYFQDVALFHKPSKTLLVCDAVLAVTDEPPAILTAEPEYLRALLFHARDDALDVMPDTPENRRKGWRRIVLLFNFFIPGAVQADIGLDPLKALDFNYKYGWGGWQPFAWREKDELASFARYSNNGKLALLPIIQIILNRGVADGSLMQWVDRVTQWRFDTVVPAHLDAPVKASPAEFREPFEFAKDGGNAVRFCNKDVALLREAENGPLKFSVTPTTSGPLVGEPCGLGDGVPRVVSKELRLKWTPR